MNQWYCYIIKSEDGKTYNGMTNNLARRLRQHNGELVGGAKATKGRKWEYIFYMTGFADKINCLSCEWRIKHPTNERRRPSKYCNPIGRIKSLNIVLNTDKWTSKCQYDNKDYNYDIYIRDEYKSYLGELPANFKMNALE
jgi:putative endonuclease